MTGLTKNSALSSHCGGNRALFLLYQGCRQGQSMAVTL